MEEQRGQADKKIMKRLGEVRNVGPHRASCAYTPLQLFQERPVWTRAAIFNQFLPMEVRDIIKSVHKFMLFQVTADISGPQL